MRKYILLLALAITAGAAFAQDEEGTEERGFKTENIFTGGSISLSFGNNIFLVGANPMLGYKLAEWVDAGIVINYQYTNYRDYYVVQDRLRQNIFGGGAFVRLFPINFVFAQAQFEHNFINLKYLPYDGSATQKASTSANSLLVGAGYANGRMPGVNNTFFYFSVLWDVSGNNNSPYTDNYSRAVPIFRAGVNVFPFRQR